MKKSYFLIIALAVLAFGIITAFGEGDNMSPEQQEQMDQIKEMVELKLDTFRMQKDAECRARALEIAIVKADSIMTAQASAKKTITRKTTTKKTTTETAPPPPPAPTTKGGKARENRNEETQPVENTGPTKGQKAKSRRSGGN